MNTLAFETRERERDAFVSSFIKSSNAFPFCCCVKTRERKEKRRRKKKKKTRQCNLIPFFGVRWRSTVSSYPAARGRSRWLEAFLRRLSEALMKFQVKHNFSKWACAGNKTNASSCWAWHERWLLKVRRLHRNKCVAHVSAGLGAVK